MSGNAKQRTTLTNLNEPQQMRELNRQLTWIWDQLLGGLGLKALNSGARKVIDSKASCEEVDELSGTVEQYGTQIQQSAKEIALKADKTVVDALGNTVSQHSTSIIQTAEKIESTAKAVQTLEGKVEEQSTRITQTAEKVESKAEKAVVDELGNAVSRHESTISQTPEQIRMAVENVQVGGTNMIRNTGTLKTANHLIDESGASARGSCTEDEFGGFHVVCKNENIRCWMGEYAVSPGQSYAMSVRYKMNSGAAPIQFQYVLKSAGGADLYFWDSVNHSTTSTIAEDGWKVLRSVFTVPDDPAVAKVSLALRTGLDGWLYTCDYNIRRPKFETGNKATAWSPAPEDTDAAIDELSAALVVQAGEITANATKIETVGQAAGNAQNSANAAQNTANAAQNAANGAQGTANNAVTRVTTAEQRISAVEGAITSKVEKADFDALGNKVSANTSAITQTAEGIRSEVAGSVSGLQTQIEQTDKQVLILAGRTVGGTNMIRNTGTLKTANYAIDSSGASALGSCTEDEFGGFRVVCNNANVRCWMGEYAVTPGQSYAMSVRYKMNSGNSPIQFQYVLKSAGGADLYYWESVNHSTTSTITEDGWTVMRSVFAVPNDPAVAKVSIALRTGWDGALYTVDYNIRRPKFEAGSMPTDWSPSPDDPAGSVRAGSSVLITEDKIKLAAPETEIAIPGTDGERTVAKFDADGLTAERVQAGNVSYRYDGPAALYVNPNATSAQIAAGNCFRSLTDALNALNGKYLTHDVYIHLESDMYGDAELTAMSGRSVIINGNGHTLYGALKAHNTSIGMDINGLTINRPASSGNPHALELSRCGYVGMYQCRFIAAGVDTAVSIGQGVRTFMHECELRGADKLIYLWYCCDLQALNLKGGDCSKYLVVNGATARMGGTRPDGTWEVWNISDLLPGDPNTLPIDYGTATPSVPVISTANWSYLYSDSYAGKWGIPNQDAAQGVIRTDSSGTTAAVYGTIWFDAAAIRNALTGKTLKQASLRLTMLKGYGRVTTVSVQLYGTNTAYSGRSGQPQLVTSYGTIGTTEPGTVSEITIPAAVISDIVSGKIQALVLKSDDDALYKDRDYSKNYARFAGSATADGDTCPRLTVVYQ